MRGFVIGLVVSGLAFAGYQYWRSRERAVAHGPAVTADAGAPARAAKEREKERKRRRHGARLARATASAPGGSVAPGAGSDAPVTDPEPEPVKLGPADLKLVSQGDDLSRPDVMHVDMRDDDSGSHELGQDEIDARFRGREDAILDCISHARPDEDTYVPGRVTVKFRIQRAGTVRGVRVEAPAILMRGGLYGCVKGVVGGLRFSPSNGSQVVTYPFSLS